MDCDVFPTQQGAGKLDVVVYGVKKTCVFIEYWLKGGSDLHCDSLSWLGQRNCPNCDLQLGIKYVMRDRAGSPPTRERREVALS
mmetsp:Transcript_25802/g.37769  ORF Transcript_25802/g.37769 Transcript_25802/m.37769 type:complete len:84 (+) Transcript_25802:1005-1256(+)